MQQNDRAGIDAPSAGPGFAQVSCTLLVLKADGLLPGSRIWLTYTCFRWVLTAHHVRCPAYVQHNDGAGVDARSAGPGFAQVSCSMLVLRADSQLPGSRILPTYTMIQLGNADV